MSRVAVLDHNQRETDQPRRFLKRSVGQNLVRRALAYWVVKNAVLQMLPPHEIRARALNRSVFTGPLPPAELPGIYFEDPVKRDRMSLLKQYATEIPAI